VSSTFDYLEYTIECELKVLTINPQPQALNSKGARGRLIGGVELNLIRARSWNSL
jgi:hypothetical protein